MRTRLIAIATAALLAVTVVGCGNSKSGITAPDSGISSGHGGGGATCTSPNPRQGVTDNEIRVGGIASVHNPLGFDYGEAFQGTKAYFAMVNKAGGVYGRKLKLVAAEDDNLNQNTETVKRILESDDVFAIAPVASLLFTGATTLVQQCVPTFGWNINAQWALGPNLFGDKGSHLDFSAPSRGGAYVASQVKATKVGILAYNIPQSSQSAVGFEKTWKTYPDLAKVVYTDTKIPYGLPSVSQDVAAMKKKGVDFVMAALDAPGMAKLAGEMRKQDLDATLYVSDGYYNQVRTNPNFEGAVVQTFFTPFDVADPPSGLKDYLSWMHKTHTPLDEISMAGWLAGAMLVTGIKAAGKNFTRSSVIKALNGMTDFTADGILPGIDWTIAHTDRWNPRCSAFSVVHNKKFVPTYGKKGKPFLCFPNKTLSHTAPTPTFK